MQPCRATTVALAVVGAGASVLVAGVAHADKLELGANAPDWARFGAAALLYAHIGGGTLGLIAGTIASLARKGGSVHLAAGRTFFVAMFVTYLVGAGVAPFLETGQRPNFVAGVLALYLLVTGVLAAKRRQFRAGPLEKIGLLVALAVVGMGLSFMGMGASSESGSVDGSPPQAFVVFVLGGAAAAIGEIKVLIRGDLSGSERIVRHLWRMCFSFFIAAGSLFMGQPAVFPRWFNESPLPALLSFAPIAILLVWVARSKLHTTSRRRNIVGGEAQTSAT